MFLKKFIDFSTIKTYTIGLHQAKAYRILKQTTAAALEKYHLSPLDWALMGLLLENKAGIRPSELAETLGVEAPFVTVLVDQLKQKKLVMRQKDPNDRRARLIVLSAAGRRKVEVIERDLRQSTKHLLQGLSPSEVLTYVKTLKTIVANAHTPH